jgi:2-oxoglutarate dehydrogenase complex dehydrogenase (E1) component-like enzyme
MDLMEQVQNTQGKLILIYLTINFSSSKIERFLQLTDTSGINTLYDSTKLPDHRKINFCVAQPTKPSNYFHLLRRQMMRGYRKPLVVATPKIGLKHSAYVSKIEEFTADKKFSPIIVDSFGNESPREIIFCSGQVFLEITKNIENYRKENNKVNHNIIRLEELAPFPELEIMEELQKKNLSKDAKFYWIQEESMNMGCFSYVVPHLRRIMRNLGLKSNEVEYIGRDAQSGANGCVNDHKEESANLGEAIKNLIYS